MIVSQLMTRDTVSIRGEQTLADAAHSMWNCDCGALPVVEGDANRVIGMITDRDICMATWSRGAAPHALRVVEAMSQSIVCCEEGDSLTHAEALMQANQVRRLPVVDAAGGLVGILSLADIARADETKFVPDRLVTCNHDAWQNSAARKLARAVGILLQSPRFVPGGPLLPFVPGTSVPGH